MVKGYISRTEHRLPRNKSMFLKREFASIKNFYKKNPNSCILDCSIELGFGWDWVSKRVCELVKTKQLRAIKKSAYYVFAVV